MAPHVLTPGFAFGFECGYAQGIEAGRRQAEAELDACWRETARKVRALASQPTYDELRRGRGEAA